MRLKTLSHWILVIALATLATISAGDAVALGPQSVTRVSVSSEGAQADGNSFESSISEDGRFIAFTSDADNLVQGDTNGVFDVFVRDRVAGTTTRVSVGLGGSQANENAGSAQISADGRYVAYSSEADNLVVGDTNGVFDVFVYDRVSATTSRVSVDSSGTQADDYSDGPRFSEDGRCLAFFSGATNLVGGDTNGRTDIFVRDMVTGAMSRVSVSSTGAQSDDESWNPSLSADGRYVAFESGGTTLVTGDTNAHWDVFVHDRATGTTVRGSVNSAAEQGNQYSDSAWMFPDGRSVAFASAATNLVGADTNGDSDIFVRDLVAGTTTRISLDSSGTQTNGDSYGPRISADGRCMAFVSMASNMDPSDTNGKRDIYLRDLLAGTTVRCSAGTTGAHGNGDSSHAPAISSDARYVSFNSSSTDLVSGDTNLCEDVFLAEMALTEMPCSVALSSAPRSSLPYGAAFAIKGVLASGGAGLAGRRVIMQSAAPGASFKDTSYVATTGAAGAFTFSVKPRSKTYYRVRFAGSFGLASADSTRTCYARPKARLSRSTSWTTLRRNKTHYAKGFIEPSHAKDDPNKVRIRAYRRGAHGTYKYVKSFSARYAYYSATKTRYRALVRLASRGYWKLVAYHAADSVNARTYGSIDYVRVK